MQRFSTILTAMTLVCFLMQVPMPVQAKEAVKMRPGNIKTATGVVKSAHPDLVVSKINYSPGQPSTGSEITLWVFIKNNGRGQAQASAATVRVGGETNPPLAPVPALNPGQEWRYTRKLTLTKASNYIVKATADAQGQVAESREGNNTRTTTIAVKSELPDLVISKVNYSPGQPDTNSKITVWVFVKNVGLSRADTSVSDIDVTPKPSGGGYAAQQVPALNPGQEWRYTKKFYLDRAGSFYVTIKADRDTEVAEAKEHNNKKKIAVAVKQGPKPDLVVTKINFSPGQPKQHEQVTVWYFVKNIGQGISRPCILGTTNSLNAYSIWHEERVPALEPGREWRYQGLFLSNAAGDYKIKAVIDKGKKIFESNENNNERLKDIKVKKTN